MKTLQPKKLPESFEPIIIRAVNLPPSGHRQHMSGVGIRQSKKRYTRKEGKRVQVD